MKHTLRVKIRLYTGNMYTPYTSFRVHKQTKAGQNTQQKESFFLFRFYLDVYFHFHFSFSFPFPFSSPSRFLIFIRQIVSKAASEDSELYDEPVSTPQAQALPAQAQPGTICSPLHETVACILMHLRKPARHNESFFSGGFI